VIRDFVVLQFYQYPVFLLRRCWQNRINELYFNLVDYLSTLIQPAAMKGHGIAISFSTDAHLMSGLSVARHLLSLLRLLPFWAFK